MNRRIAGNHHAFTGDSGERDRLIVVVSVLVWSHSEVAIGGNNKYELTPRVQSSHS